MKNINETIVNGNRVFIENGVVKTILSEEVQNNGYMSIEDSERITIEIIEKEYILP